MTKNKICLLALSVCFFFLSCKQSPEIENDKLGVFDQQKVSSYSPYFCKNDELLVQVELNQALVFEDLAGSVPVIGFYQGSGSCAVQTEIHDNFVSGIKSMHFNFKSSEPCVPNGSLWKVTAYGTETPNAHIDLKALGSENTLHMDASRDLPGTYVRDHTGLRQFICKSKLDIQ